MLTSDQITQARAALPSMAPTSGGSPAAPSSGAASGKALDDLTAPYNPNPAPAPSTYIKGSPGSQFPVPQLATNIKNNISSNVNEAAAHLTAAHEGKENPFSAGVGIAKNVSSALVSPVTEALGPVMNKLTDNGVVHPLVQAYADRVSNNKGVQEFADLLDKHPEVGNFIQTGMNMATFMGGKAPEAGMLEKVPGAVGDAVSKTASAVGDVASKTGDVVGGMTTGAAKTAAKQFSGLDMPTIQRVVSNPEKFTPEAMHQVTRSSVGEEVKAPLETRISDLSATGKEYGTIKDAKTPVRIDPQKFIDVLNKHGIEADKEGNLITTAESVPLSPGDKSSIEAFIKQYGPGKVNNSNSFLNARKALDNLSSWDSSKTDISNVISRSLRNVYDDAGKAQIPGLKEIDAKYAPEVKELRQLKKDYLNPDGTLKDSALNKIANATGKGKDAQLARLEKLSPGITDKIQHLKAVEDIQNTMEHHKVGAYAKGAGLGYIASGGNPLGILGGIILSDPSNAVSILRALGVAKDKIAMLTKSMTSTTDKNVIPKSLEQGGGSVKDAPSVISYIDKNGDKVYTRLTKGELAGLKDEVANIPEAKNGESQIHLDADTQALKDSGKELSREEFIKGHSQAGKILK